MIRWLTTTSIQSRLLLVTIAVGLIIIAIVQLQKTPVDIYPEFSPVYVEIQTEALGLSADEVEQFLTVALEQDLLNGIAFLDEIWSQSMQGLSRVICIFEPGTDPLAARQVVAERLTQAHALPHVSKPPVMLQPYSSTSRVMKVGLSSSNDQLDLIDLSVLARWTVQPYLMGIEGVANVSIWGQRKRQLQVQVDPARLMEKGVDLSEVIKTTGEALWVSPLTYLNSSTPGTGGFFDTPNQRLGVRHVLPISGPEDLAQIPVHGHKLMLGDVADVVENHQPLIGDAIVNGNPGLLLVVEKFPWANTLEVTERLEEALEELRPGLSGIVLNTEVYQPAVHAENTTANLGWALGIAFLLAVILIFGFFYDWKMSIVTIFSVLLSFIAGAFVLHLNGTMFNMMVLGGLILALVFIITNSIFTVENMRRHLVMTQDFKRDKLSKKQLILNAILEIRNPLLFASIILVVMALPLFAFNGLNGAFFKPFAGSLLLAMLTSLFVSMTITPALSALLLGNNSFHYRESSLMKMLQGFMGSSIGATIKKPVLAYSLLGISILAGFFVFSNLDKNGQPPSLQERDILIQWQSQNGTSHPEMNRVTMKVIEELNTVNGVRGIVAHNGRAVMSDKVFNVNSGEIWVNIDDDVDYEKTVSSIRQIVDGYPGLEQKVHNYHQQSISSSLRLSDDQYAIRVYGENQQTLQKKTEEVKHAISNVTGITDATVQYPKMEPTIEIEVDLQAARKFGVKPGDVRRTATVLLSGLEVGSLFEGQKVFEVVVWGKPEIRNSVSSVENLLISTPNGGYVRLAELADVRIKPNPTIINREAVSRYMDVSFSLENTNINKVESLINNEIAKVDFPLEYHTDLVGGFTAKNANRKRVLSFSIAALIGLFLLLQAAIYSWRLSIVVMISLSMSLTGGILAALLSRGELSMGSMLGLMAVFGIAVYQALLQIKHMTDLELNNSQEFSAAFVLTAVKDRLPSIIVSTLFIAVVFAPFAIMGNIPGLELLNPMAIVILGGLLFTLLLNIFVLPALYLQLGKISEKTLEEEKAMLDLSYPPDIGIAN